MKDMLLKLNYWKWYAYIGVLVLWQIVCGIEQKIVVYYFKENKNRKEELPMLNEEMTRDLVNGLQMIFAKNVIQIILYGSVARQEETEESDIDIAIIVENMQSAEIREKFIEWNSEMDMKYNKVFSIVDIEKTNMDKWGDILPFYKNIKEEGVVLWKTA